MTQLPTDYQTFIALSRYARWLPEHNRRETWEETVARLFDFYDAHLGHKYPRARLEKAVLNLEIMPSMRSLMAAGPALEQNHIAAYNCAYVAVDHPRVFDETLLILMNGTGVGFSVERQHISKLPEVPRIEADPSILVVKDSKKGWQDSLRMLISSLYSGLIPKWDTSLVRPPGARLNTFGGRASGPEPLEDLFRFVIRIFTEAQGRNLNSLECHDIMCKIGEVVVVGGVRRSAMISGSNLSDTRMRDAKHGQWWAIEPQRALSNNSVIYTEKPDIGIFMEEWKSLYESKSGERGMFNREAAKKHVAALETDRDPNYDFFCNPCSEILLRSAQFCNLSEIVIRPEDNMDTLKTKVELATILGTMQSSLTNFKGLRHQWKHNTEEERLLGVSMTGIMDSTLTNGTKNGLSGRLKELRAEAVKVNRRWAKKFDIQASKAITCTKPSGTVSQLVNSASGIHARHNPYFVRTVRGDNKDPMTQFMISKGIPNEPDVMRPDHTTVFSFPMKSPRGAICRTDMTALEQLEIWLIYATEWTHHKPSVTVSVKEHEWLQVGAWVYDHFDTMSGVSFLPYSEHSYQQAPYQDCTKDEYFELIKQMPKGINWEDLSLMELEDHTTGSQELACAAGGCEIVDLTSGD